MPGPGVDTVGLKMSRHPPAQTLKDKTVIYGEVLRENVAVAVLPGKQPLRQS